MQRLEEHWKHSNVKEEGVQGFLNTLEIMYDAYINYCKFPNYRANYHMFNNCD